MHELVQKFAYVKPLTDEQVFYDKFTLASVRMYAQQFFMTSFSLTSLSVVVRRHDAYTKCTIHRRPTYYWAQFTLLTVQTDKFVLCQFFHRQVHLLKS